LPTCRRLWRGASATTSWRYSPGPEILARIRDLASQPGGETPEVFTQRVRSDLAIWRDTAKVAGIEPQ
jgi:hypothetical protein